MLAFQYLLASLSAARLASAVPTELSQRPPTDRELSDSGTIVKRATGSLNDPHIININCADSHDLCEANAYSILCRLIPNPIQYGGGISGKNRQVSGYSASILRSSNANRLSHGIDISDDTLNTVGRSMEENAMALSVQGGVGEMMVAADPKQNSIIGGRVGGGLMKKKVKEDQWFLRWYTNWWSYERKKYLPALQCNCDYDHEFCPPCTPDHTVCAPTDDALDPANRAFMAEYVDQKNARNNKYGMMGPNDVWTGHYKGSFNKERGLMARNEYKYAEQYYSGGPNCNVTESEKSITPPDDSDAGEFTLPE